MRRLDNGVALERIAELPFSNNRLIFADYDNLFRLLNDTLIEHDKGYVNKCKLVFQLVAEDLKDVAQTGFVLLNITRNLANAELHRF